MVKRSSTLDTVSGLDAGANDYLSKPFKFDELLARIRSRLRESIDMLEGVLRRVRELSFELRPANQDEPGSVKDRFLHQSTLNI